jgi:ABC-type amino acid transport system permease subunit
MRDALQALFSIIIKRWLRDNITSITNNATSFLRTTSIKQSIALNGILQKVRKIG